MAITIINVAIQRLQQYGQCTGDDAPHRHHSSSVCERQVFWLMTPAVLLQITERLERPLFPKNHQLGAILQNIHSGLRHTTVSSLGIKHTSGVCVSILFWSVILGVQDPYWVTLYCFIIRTLWCRRDQGMLNARLLAKPVGVPRCGRTSVGKASRCLGGPTASGVLPLVL